MAAPIYTDDELDDEREDQARFEYTDTRFRQSDSREMIPMVPMLDESPPSYNAITDRSVVSPPSYNSFADRSDGDGGSRSYTPSRNHRYTQEDVAADPEGIELTPLNNPDPDSELSNYDSEDDIDLPRSRPPTPACRRARPSSMAEATPLSFAPDIREGRGVELSEIARNINTSNSRSTDVESASPDDSTPPSGVLNRIISGVRQCDWSSLGQKIKIALVVGMISLLSLVMFVALFTPSVIYVNYDEVALLRSRITQVVDRSTVWYPGCHVLTPDAEFLRFKGTAYNVAVDMSIFSQGSLSVNMRYTAQYFLKPEEIGMMYERYSMGFESVFELVMSNTVKNEATKFSVNDYRLNRTKVEMHFHKALKQKMEGNCCPTCCPSKCTEDSTCATCQPQKSCDHGYFIRVKYFQLGAIKIPAEVFEQYLAQVLLQVDVEKENFFLEKAVVTKETEQKVKKITNEADEILKNATAGADLLSSLAEVDASVVKDKAHYGGLKNMYLNLNIVQQDHKLSLFYMKTLNERLENNLLLAGYEKLWTST